MSPIKKLAYYQYYIVVSIFMRNASAAFPTVMKCLVQYIGNDISWQIIYYIYHHEAVDNLCKSTRIDVTSYFMSTANRKHLFIFGQFQIQRI